MLSVPYWEAIPTLGPTSSKSHWSEVLARLAVKPCSIEIKRCLDSSSVSSLFLYWNDLRMSSKQKMNVRTKLRETLKKEGTSGTSGTLLGPKRTAAGPMLCVRFAWGDVQKGTLSDQVAPMPS